MKRAKTKTQLVAGLFSGLVLCLSLSWPARAAETSARGEETIGISPTSKKYTLDAGEVRADEVTIINPGPTPFSFTVYAKPYSVRDENYDPDFFKEQDNTDIHTWITSEKKSYTINPSESVKVKYTIRVPQNAAPGGHYGVLFAETQLAGAPEGTTVERKKRVGALIYATVNGAYQMGGTFTDISIPSLQFKPPIQAAIKAQNTGNADFEAETVLGVSVVFGNMKYSDTKRFQVLPHTTRNMAMQWEGAPGFGLYKVTVSSKFLDQKTTKTSYVLMAPISYYLIFAVGALIAAIFFVQKRR